MVKDDFVGIDVAKDKFDAGIEVQGCYKHKVFTNNITGYEAFLSWLNTHVSNPWVCMEATGHYSNELADYLVSKSIRVSVANPYAVKNFAKACLVRNKNDNIDTKVNLQFGGKMKPRFYVAMSSEQKEIKELINLLDLLKQQLTQFTNQLQSVRATQAKKSLDQIIVKLKKDIAEIGQQIANLIASNAALSQTLRLITSIKGIGKLTAYHIIALMPDISRFTHAKQYAAFMGITPKQHLSGKLIGKTTLSKLGDPRLRKALYMAALVAKRYNKSLACFVSRLQTKGKKPKTIICAVMRKLAHIIFGVLKGRLPFNKNIPCI